MAALTFQHSADLGFDNSGNFTTAAFDTTGDTWLVLYVGNFSVTGGAGNVTALTYNGVSILANLVVNTATGHIVAGSFGIAYMGLGANAGSHTFNIQWTGSGFLDFQVISGNGDLDAGVIDGAPAISGEVVSTTTLTPTPYTPTTNNALPIIATCAAAPSVTITANANCTLGIVSGLEASHAIFYCPLSTPAGTATSAVMNAGAIEFWQTISFAFKPSGGAGAVVGSNFYRQVAGLGA